MKKKRNSNRRNRSKRYPASINNYDKTKVTVAVPASVARKIPRTIVAPTISQWRHYKKHLRVPIKRVRPENTVQKGIVVYTPKSNRPIGGKAMLKGKTLTIFGKKNVQKTLKRENNRKRHDETKDFKRKRHTGYITSVRSDRYGVIGANVHRPADKLADAALVNVALENFWR